MITPLAPSSLAYRPFSEARPTRRFETFVFLLLSVLIWPFVAVGVVGGYGFAVWMWQMVSAA